MAGIALLYARTQNKTENRKRFDHFEQTARQLFGAYFKEIVVRRPNENTSMVWFRKHDEAKLYEDTQGNWLAYEGQVFSRFEARIYNAADLWRLYSKYNEELPDHLDGQFVIKLYDAQKNQFLIFNDFIKNKTNFICESDDYILFTPFAVLSAVIKEPVLDRYAFNEFLWRYYIMSERSMLEGVYHFPAATLYTIQNGALRQINYWTWPKEYQRITFREAKESMVHSMKESAQIIQQYGRKPLIEWTMGQDSRQVVAAFTNQNIPFEATIFGKPDYIEVPAVLSMAKRHGVTAHHIMLEEAFLNNPWDIYKQSILLSSAEEPFYLIGRILYMRSLYRAISDLAVNGVHGRYYKDGLWNEMYIFNFYREPKRFNIDVFLKYRALNKNYRDDIFTHSFREVKAESMAYFRGMIEHSIAGWEHSPVAMQVDKFDCDHYANFGCVANSVCNNYIDLFSPLLFRRNMELAIQLPVKWRYNLSAIQRAVVHGLDADIAREKTDFGGLNMVPKNSITMMPFLIQYWFAQSKKFRDKIKNRLGFNTKTQLQKAWDYKPVYQSVFQNDEVRALLEYSDMALGGLLEEESWRTMLQQYREPTYQTVEHFEFLYKILTLEYFMRAANTIYASTFEESK